MIDYYGTPTPINQVAGISVPEATQLLIKPFDKGCLGNIEKAINLANLGYNPSNDGETIRIVIPALTEERRRELTKQVKAMAEEAKVSIRNIRHEANLKIEKITDGYAQLSWQAATDNDTQNAPTYVIYGSENYPVDINKPENIIAQRVQDTTFVYAPIVPWKAKRYFAVTATDRYGNEGPPVTHIEALYLP